jgi:dihydrodipicolinate synthase/N-acetylneuraminate lyase
MSSRRAHRRLAGALAAAVTPLRDGGRSLDEDAVAPYVDFLRAHGVSGVLTLGTTGEGLLLSTAERRRVTELFLAASSGRLAVAAHCGAQTTDDSVLLAEHAAAAGADAVAVIGPPYFALDPAAQLEHLLAVARACAPTPFYVYELERASGYPFDVPMLLRLREAADNFVGMKVSDTPWDAFARYLLEGIDVLVGSEALIHRAMGAGAVGTVSALAAAFPDRVSAVAARPSAAGASELGVLRARVERGQRHAGLKTVLGLRGVPVRPDVRRPLRALTDAERQDLERWSRDGFAAAASTELA